MLLKEFQVYAIQAAAGKEVAQTALCVAIAGTSGAGNSSLTRILFPNLVQRGLMTLRTKGRVKYYTSTQKGLDSLVK